MLIRATLFLRNEKMLVARKKFGLSQKALASVAGVSVWSVTCVECLKFDRITEQQITSIAGALDMRPEELVPPEVVGKVLPTKFVTVEDVAPEKIASSATRSVGYLEMKHSVEEWYRTLKILCEPEEADLVLARMSGKTWKQLHEKYGYSVERLSRIYDTAERKILLASQEGYDRAQELERVMRYIGMFTRDTLGKTMAVKGIKGKPSEHFAYLLEHRDDKTGP